MNCYDFKGGSGTASRVVDLGDSGYTVGVFLQSNFGKRAELTIAGRAAGRRAGRRQPDRGDVPDAGPAPGR